MLEKKKEDRIKDAQEYSKILSEQQIIIQADPNGKKKEKCIQILGEELYNKVYDCLKKAREKNSFKINELKQLVGNDKEKLNISFLIEQIIDSEMAVV